MTEYDYHWPFPQRDEHGNPLVPPKAPREKRDDYPADVGEALL